MDFYSSRRGLLDSIYGLYKITLMICISMSTCESPIIFKQKIASDATIYNPMFFDYD